MGCCVEKPKDVADGWGLNVAVEPGIFVAVGTIGTSLVGVITEGNEPKTVEVAVGVFGMITAISGNPPVSGGLSTPSKSLMISNPMAGTECIISSTE